MSVSGRRILALFDVDGTLTAPRAEVTPEMKQYIVRDLRNVVTVGIVGGSDLVKQREQMGSDITDLVDYSFSENGLVAYKDGVLVGKQSIQTHLGEEKIKQLVNWILRYIADLDIPVKRGTFIEFRSGMLNVSPIGRNCSKEERNAYEEYDLQNKVRATMVEAMKERFADFGLVFSIGGQISFDVFPSGWDKTYALNFIPEKKADGTVDHRMDDGKTHPFDEIHFFGDKTFAGGNDYEIFTHPRVIGHTVTSPEDTRRQCEALFTGSM